MACPSRDDAARRLTDQRFNRLVLLAILGGTFLVSAFVTALSFANAGEIAAALGGVLGGMIGAGGAAVAVYLTLSGQREEDRTRISGALVREVIEFARLVVGHLETCENIRAGTIALPAAGLAEAMEMPHPIVYPAVADKVGLLVRPQRVVAFYARIVEIAISVRAISRGPRAHGTQSSILSGADIKTIVEAWIDIAQFAQWTIRDADTGDEFDRAVRASILADLPSQIAFAREKFEIESPIGDKPPIQGV
jgi:hypothetical protein